MFLTDCCCSTYPERNSSMVNMQITPIDTMAETVEDVRRTMIREAA
jgi:hypothetical protein